MERGKAAGNSRKEGDEEKERQRDRGKTRRRRKWISLIFGSYSNVGSSPSVDGAPLEKVRVRFSRKNTHRQRARQRERGRVNYGVTAGRDRELQRKRWRGRSEEISGV